PPAARAAGSEAIRRAGLLTAAPMPRVGERRNTAPRGMETGNRDRHAPYTQPEAVYYYGVGIRGRRTALCLQPAALDYGRRSQRLFTITALVSKADVRLYAYRQQRLTTAGAGIACSARGCLLLRRWYHKRRTTLRLIEA
ncbi:MAG: hypothetical protein LBB61_03645, partial [Treponema sp.]|nr:hypothetical protein [Treponema sp.]